jgi:lipoate-protein ligase A
MANYYEKINQDARENSALEKTLIDKNENFLLCGTIQKSVFIGTGVSSTTFNENDDGVILTRYNGNGGPVYFDEGNIKCSLLLDHIDNGQTVCHEWIGKSLKDLGIETTSSGNDIYLNGKKICGIGTKTIGDKIFLPFFISLYIDFEIASRVMNLTKHTDNLQERAIGVNQVLEQPISAEQIINALKLNFNSFWGTELQDFVFVPDLEYEKCLEQYNSDEWIKYGRVTKKPDYV